MRTKVSIFLAVSLDGFIADNKGGVGWLDAFSGGNDDAGYHSFYSSIDCLLMGRKSWESVIGFDPWPYPGMRVLVRTTRPLKPLHSEEPVTGSITQILEGLHRDAVKHVYVDGGETVRDALREDVVDEVTLTRIPILLGQGIPLFNDSLPQKRWTLLSERPCELGMTQATYTPRIQAEVGCLYGKAQPVRTSTVQVV